MKRRAACALGGLVIALAAAQGCHRQAALPLGLVVGSGAPITFPSSDEAWSERIPIPAGSSPSTLKADAPLRVTTPALDDQRHFETKGQIIRIYFNEAVVDLKTKKAPSVKIRPAVAGRTVWTYASEVEFRAEKPFDPDTEYTIEIPELTSPSGKKLEGGFKATFKADPEIEVAGKTINYVPKPGHARPIVVSPSDDSVLGGPQELQVVYDQPVDLALAKRLLSISAGDTKLAAVVRHPERRAFEGQKIDPRFIVLVKPAELLPGGTKLTVAAKSQHDDDKNEERAQTYRIAEPTKLREVTCNAGDCEVKDGFVRGTTSATLTVRFTNPLGLGYSDGKKHVHITPQPKSLYVSGWDDLSISASFTPSTKYTITTDGIRDKYGGTAPPVALTFETRPLPASATMSEGVTLLDEGATRAFPVTTRNVEKAELVLWALPKGDVAAYGQALKDTRAWTPPTGEPTVIPFAPRTKRDENGETSIDLGAKLERGRAYVAQVRVVKAVEGAVASQYPAGSDASRPSMAVIFAAGKDALAAHVHQAGEKAAVQVFRLASGEPVAGARVSIGAIEGTTDAGGSVLLATGAPSGSSDHVLAVGAGDAALMMPLAGAIEARALFPELSSGGPEESAPRATDAVGMLVTDRGVYRPGSKMFVKGFVRKVQEASIRAHAGAKVRLRVTDPLGTDVSDEALVTTARGAITKEVSFAKAGHTGRFQIRLELDDGKHTLLASDMVRVADFEPPRFKVDVERTPAAAPAPQKLQARVKGTYLFGAPMGGAHVTWVLKKSRVPVKGGALADAGLSFGREHDWWDDTPSSEALRPVTGEGVLGEDGSLAIDAVAGPLADGPTELMLEADVADASNRHVAGQMRAVEDPHAHHAGLKLSRRFGDAGKPLRVELGVVDAAGAAVAGKKVTARLERLTWTRAAEKAESGASIERWKYLAKTEAECEVSSGTKPVACELPVPHGGNFRVVARVDGRDEATTSFWAYGSWLSDVHASAPSHGKKVPLVLDKGHYKSGETAKLLVQSPFAKAMALLTLEQGGLVRHESRRIEGPSATLDIPVSAANAPWLHAAVTLLPIGESEADYRVGVVRVPVGADDAKLEVRVTSAKKAYEIRDDAEITVEVRKNGVPVRNADVTLGVVDEGVLRMTAYHPKDPVTALRPGHGLDFHVSDSRAAMLRRREKAHTAGGGDSEGEESLDTRKSFVETAAWLPDLVTDGEGRAKTKVKLPDNLTEFRMTAVVVDDVGGGGTSESSFVVTRPLLLEPIMPRFALRGDRFEAAAMVHNNTDAPVAAQVTVAGEVRDVTIPARNHARVAVALSTDEPGTRKMLFALAVGGAVKDKVEIPLRVDEPGLDEHPMASGVFGDRQEVHLAIPADAVFEDGAALSVKTGSALYPELGQRLSYLLDYPHGCVEQTTSGTIPLLAARTILPWTGSTVMDDDELRKRIDAGVTRLATMQTAGGGLAYWPGGSEPNLYGSAYALRALLRAKERGIERPKLIEGVTKFLVSRLGEDGAPELRMSIAEVLAQANELPASSADSLYDMREKLDAFGLASLALALASLPKQHDRVTDVLDRLELAFDDKGAPAKAHDSRDWHYWGSDDRDRAQATIALSRLRRTSKVLPVLAARLSKTLDHYSTQSTAWSLLALSDYVGTRSPDGAVDVSVKLEGKILDTFVKLGGDNKEVRIPLKDLAGKKVTLLLAGDPQTPSAFALEARYKRPLEAGGTRLARRGARGVSIHRAYSDAAGKLLDLSQVKPGQIVRVAVRIEMPKLDDYRLGYLAVTDRLPAGFEALNTDLATTGSVAELSKDHPFFEGLSGYGSAASHVDLRDDRVQLYFDHVYGGRAVYASYLARATTQGTFTVPPAGGELMYEGESEGYTDSLKVTVK